MRSGPILVALLLLAGPPAAADETEARPHRERAQRLYEDGKLEVALVEFTASYDAQPQPDLLLPLGHCHRRLGHADAALFFYRGYLGYFPEGHDRLDVERLIAELEARRAATAAAPTPAYRRWWVWTIALAVIAAAGAATGILLGSGIFSPMAPLPTDTLGRIDARPPL